MNHRKLEYTTDIVRSKTIYWGITYPFLSCVWIPDFLNRWLYNMWASIFCCRGMHLFDEVTSKANGGDVHYLHCDACGFVLHINAAEPPNHERVEVRSQSASEKIIGKKGTFIVTVGADE